MLPRGVPYPELRIVLDRYGVPSISADSMEAAFFGAGYMHAYHRLVQIESVRRMGRGELAAFAGKEYLQSDKMFRKYALERVAGESLKLYTQEEYALIQANVDGINFCIENMESLPAAFQANGVPRPWTPEDSLICGLVMKRMLTTDADWTVNFENQKKLIKPALLDLIGGVFNESVVSQIKQEDLPDFAIAKSTLPQTAKLLPSENESFVRGSNCFVISGALTESGKPILASDPHLDAKFPSTMYELRYSVGDWKARGMTLAGLPVIVIGANEHCVWGNTALLGDMADAIRYKVRELKDGPGEYLTRDGWKTFEIEEVVYEILDSGGIKRETETIRRTEAGPVFFYEGKSVIVQSWVGLFPDKEGTAYIAVGKAKSVFDIQKAVTDVSTAINFVCADSSGNIAYFPSGKFPVRSYDGGKTADGETADLPWKRFVTAAELPGTFNPSCGYIVSANNQVYPDGFELSIYGLEKTDAERLLGGFRAFGHRALRIEELLQEMTANGRKISPSDAGRIQADTYSRLGKGFRDFAVETLASAQFEFGPPESGLSAAYYALQSWDGRCDLDSVGPCVVFLMLRKTIDRILKPRGWPTMSDRSWSKGFDFGRRLGDLWDDPKTGELETAADILYWALEESAAHLEKTIGTPENWLWGALNMLDHTSVTGNPANGKEGYSGTGGAQDSPWPGVSVLSESGLLIVQSAPAMRLIAVPGDLESGYFSVIPGGQSGDAASVHALDQLELFLAGTYK